MWTPNTGIKAGITNIDQDTFLPCLMKYEFGTTQGVRIIIQIWTEGKNVIGDIKYIYRELFILIHYPEISSEKFLKILTCKQSLRLKWTKSNKKLYKRRRKYPQVESWKKIASQKFNEKSKKRRDRNMVLPEARR